MPPRLLACHLAAFLATWLACLPASAADPEFDGHGPKRLVVEQVIDGDTLRGRVAIWFGQTVQVDVRLLGIQAPETRSGPCRDKGQAAKMQTEALVNGAGSLVDLYAIQLDKYAGRVDALVRLPDGRSLNDVLVATGYAVPYAGSGPLPDGCAVPAGRGVRLYRNR